MKCEHTPTPWIVDDRHIHSAMGLTYPRGVEPETDVVVMVDTDCHENGLLHDTDRAKLEFIVRACNSHAELVRVLKEALTHNGVEHDTTLKEMIVSALKTAGEEV